MPPDDRLPAAVAVEERVPVPVVPDDHVRPLPGDDADQPARRDAGRRLELDEEVYRSEAATNFRNRGIAKLLGGYGRMYFDALESTDIYTRQCSLRVTVKDGDQLLTDQVISDLMGKDVAARFKMITENAADIGELDV